MSVCLSVGLSLSICPLARLKDRSPNFTNCNTLCIYGFGDDVKFAHNGAYDAWLRGGILKVIHQGAAPGQNMMSRTTFL